MNFVYSPDADALYIELKAERVGKVARTVEVSPSCLVDLDGEGRPLGVELLNVLSLGVRYSTVRHKETP